MHRLMAGLGGCFGPTTRQDTINLAQFMLRNDVLDRLEQRTDVRYTLFLDRERAEVFPRS